MTEANNPQYAPGQSIFGFPGQPESTGAQGSSPSEGTPPVTLQHGQLGSGLPAGETENSTSAPGSNGPTPPADGGSVTVTNPGWSGIADGTKTGTANTSKSAETDPFVKGGSFGGSSFDATDTGAGRGSAQARHP